MSHSKCNLLSLIKQIRTYPVLEKINKNKKWLEFGFYHCSSWIPFFVFLNIISFFNISILFFHLSIHNQCDIYIFPFYELSSWCTYLGLNGRYTIWLFCSCPGSWLKTIPRLIVACRIRIWFKILISFSSIDWWGSSGQGGQHITTTALRGEGNSNQNEPTSHHMRQTGILLSHPFSSLHWSVQQVPFTITYK